MDITLYKPGWYTIPSRLSHKVMLSAIYTIHAEQDSILYQTSLRLEEGNPHTSLPAGMYWKTTLPIHPCWQGCIGRVNFQYIPAGRDVLEELFFNTSLLRKVSFLLSPPLTCGWPSPVQYCVVLYCVVLYYTVLYYTVLYYTVLYYTVLYW